MLFLKNSNQESDAQLVRKYRNSYNNSYIGELFQRYTHLVFGVCMKYLKDEKESRDAAEQIFELVVAELKRRDVKDFKNWLHTITKNHCEQILKSRKENIRNEAGAVNSNPNKEISGKYSTATESELVKTAIQQLDKTKQTCLELFYLEGKSYKEIAETMNFSLSQVKDHIQFGRKELKQQIARLKNE